MKDKHDRQYHYTKTENRVNVKEELVNGSSFMSAWTRTSELVKKMLLRGIYVVFNSWSKQTRELMTVEESCDTRLYIFIFLQVARKTLHLALQEKQKVLRSRSLRNLQAMGGGQG